MGLSEEIDRNLVEFDRWKIENSDSDLDGFAKDHKLTPDVVAGIREIILRGDQVGKILSSGHQRLESKGPRTQEQLELEFGGGFRVIRKIGTGGMGTVWLAEQKSPVNREVAIKLIRPEMESDLILKRFEAEKQAMARMSHPNVAHVLDAGTTANGRPFFVMEYVAGSPVTEYCNEQGCSIEMRLEIFLQICDAVQHAHQKALLHRDIKPGNVLVANNDGHPSVKVIDFGLAISLGPNAKDPRLTQTQIILGSPLWMSPEQAKGRLGGSKNNLDTRSDIFSMGVLLYQLLTNTTPITSEFASDADSDQVFDSIRNDIPPYPSVRIRQNTDSKRWIESQAGTNFSTWSSTLKNDLDWITMRCLEKEPDRRYPTVAALGDDIRRFLKGEPVTARPPSTSYRLKKVFNKHRFASLACLLATAAMIGATIVSIRYAVYANQQKLIAQQQKEIAEKEIDTANYLNEFVARSFGQVNFDNPSVQNGEAKRAVLTTMAEDMNRTLAEMPRVDEKTALMRERRLREDMAKAYSSAGMYKDSVAELNHIVSLSSKELGRDSEQAIRAKVDLAFASLEVRAPELARKMAKEALESAQRHHRENDSLCFGAAVALAVAGQTDENVVVFTQELEGFREQAEAVVRICPADVVKYYDALGAGYRRQHKYQEAAVAFDKAILLASQHYGKKHRETVQLEILSWESDAMMMKDLDSPVDINSFVVGTQDRLGEWHPLVLDLKNKAARILFEQGKSNEALQMIRTNIAGCNEFLEDGHQTTLDSHYQHHLMLLRMRKYDEAIAHVDKTLPIFIEHRGKDNGETLDNLYIKAASLQRSGRADKALEVVEQYLPVTIEKLGPNSRLANNFSEVKAHSLRILNRFDEAIPLMLEIVKSKQNQFGAEAKQVAYSLDNLARAYQASGDLDKAIETYKRSLNLLQKNWPPFHPDCLRMLGLLQDALLQNREFELSQEYGAKCLEISQSFSEKLPPFALSMINVKVNTGMAECYEKMGEFELANDYLDKASNNESDVNSLPLEKTRIKSIRASCWTNEKRYEDAERLLVEAYEDFERTKTKDHWLRTGNLERLVRLYTAWGKPDLVKKYQKLLL